MIEVILIILGMIFGGVILNKVTRSKMDKANEALGRLKDELSKLGETTVKDKTLLEVEEAKRAEIQKETEEKKNDQENLSDFFNKHLNK